MIDKKRFVLSAVMAWLLSLTIDFLAHATLLNHLWAQELPVFKSKQELFYLIPFGYISFLILTLLVGWVYTNLHKEHGSIRKGASFGAVFGGLCASSTFFSWYSVLNLPILFIALISTVYFVEIVGVGLCFGYLIHPSSVKKRVRALIIVIALSFVLALILQNTLPTAPSP